MNSSADASASSSWRIEPVGDRCLLVAFGDRVDAEVNRTVLSFSAWLLDHPLPGVVDVVPSFTTVALHYQPEAYAQDGSAVAPYAQLAQRVREVLTKGIPPVELGGRTVEIPCCYGGEHGPDLEDVARRCGLSTDEVIRLHGESPFVVYTFYFAPGNPFAGGLDPRLSVPRRQTPRTQVPAGAVAIANNLTTVYQLAMPGGWNLIGRTPLSMFNIKQDPPVRLQLGDRLRFVPITPAQFDRLYEARS
ncbi:hypothetical protein CAL29_20220 [Bordetella genomosp. 10]|uniref:Carboxyltransferase domain-containing protein n=1 Tax=Bordetella genomosp. 10 TaxID=1416804 RepID=A0A261RZ37_9BORD|nr:5-oxoprolinase subunit PxpB [Bordetella genomosp. 10]OZI30364.1 hypothetical protein CAL29_20220 [Bordetella genomosp. 10]